MPLFEHPAVWQEFEDAIRYYAAINPDLAVDFGEAVNAYRERLCEKPKLFPVRRANVRQVNLAPQFNEWYLAFIIWNDQIVLLGLGHAKRRPFYSHRRIDEAKKLF